MSVGVIAPAAERISRLTGRGRTDDRGGGLPLVNLFEPILRTIYERGPQPMEPLIDAVKAGFLGRKESRLQFIYRTNDPWPAVLADALDQLVAQRILAEDGNRWVQGPKFHLDTKMTVIARNGQHPAETVTVLSAAAREASGSDALNMEITALATELDERRGGLRPVNQERVAEIKESMRAFGYLPDFPVLKDKHGRILDGRHRAAAAEALGIKPVLKEIPVSSDREALAITWAANAGQAGWTDKDLKRITQALGGVAPTVALSERVQIRNVLLNHAGRISDREVARLLGCSHVTVGERRADLEREGAIAPYDPDAEKAEKIREAAAQHPDKTYRALGRMLGVSHNTVKQALQDQSGHGGQTVQSDQNDLPVEPELTPLQQTIKEAIETAPPGTSNREIAKGLLNTKGEPLNEIAVRQLRKKLGMPPSPTKSAQAVVKRGGIELTHADDLDYLEGELCSFITNPSMLVTLGLRLQQIGEQRGGVPL